MMRRSSRHRLRIHFDPEGGSQLTRTASTAGSRSNREQSAVQRLQSLLIIARNRNKTRTASVPLPRGCLAEEREAAEARPPRVGRPFNRVRNTPPPPAPRTGRLAAARLPACPVASLGIRWTDRRPAMRCRSYRRRRFRLGASMPPAGRPEMSAGRGLISSVPAWPVPGAGPGPAGRAPPVPLRSTGSALPRTLGGVVTPPKPPGRRRLVPTGL